VSVRQITQAKVANADADKFLHFISQLIKHAAYLAVDPLPKHNSETCDPDWLDLIHAGPLPIQDYSREQFGG
jgi:hypothetical protein